MILDDLKRDHQKLSLVAKYNPNLMRTPQSYENADKEIIDAGKE